MLVRAEVDVDGIPHDTILSYSNKEYVLKYAPQNGFQEWLSEIEGVMTVSYTHLAVYKRQKYYLCTSTESC